MRIEGVTEEQNKEQLSSLQLVNLGRTNINQVKFLSHYEFSGNQKILKTLSKDPNLFLANLYKMKYQIFDAKIASIGEILNFKLRINESQNINEVNILTYAGNTFIPREVRGFEPDESIIYTIRFYSAKKIEIDADQVEEYVNNPSLTKQVISDCDSKVATLKDHEEIYASGDCHNAKLASKEISKKRNSASNKPTEVKIVH